MIPRSFFILAVLLITASLSAAARPDSFDPLSSEQKELNQGNSKPSNQNNNKHGGGNTGGIGGFFGPGPGFGLPGFENGWGNGIVGGGYGAGFGGPTGGYSKGGVIKPTVVCKEKGPCYNKKLICPAKCFTHFSQSGKGYGGGGGGGGCTMDDISLPPSLWMSLDGSPHSSSCSFTFQLSSFTTPTEIHVYLLDNPDAYNRFETE